jgi:hypothetical protein
MDVLDRPDGHFLHHHFLMIAGMLVWELVSPTIERRGFLMVPTTGERAFSSVCWVPPTFTWPGSGSPISFVVGAAHFSGLDRRRHALGIEPVPNNAFFQTR